MEHIKEILKIQNLELLKIIAEDKFDNEEDKEEFIERYNKINYKSFKIEIGENNTLENYNKIINALLIKNK